MSDHPKLPLPNISIVTLGVEDLALSTRFYEQLGWVNTMASQDSVSFLQGEVVVLGLYGRSELAKDASVPNDPAGFRGVAMARNLASEAEVDKYFAHALSVGAVAIKTPEKVFWGGYSGYIADPDGHLWEIAFNPFIEQNTAGQLALEPKDIKS